MKKVVFIFLLLLIPISSFSEHAVLFVSLGMPDAVLRAYVQQAHRHHIPVVIRGLYTNPTHDDGPNKIGNFHDTIERMQHLLLSSSAGGLSIDPLLFQAFSIASVPALVIFDDQLSCVHTPSTTPASACDPKTFDVVYGNGPLKKLIQVVRDRSEQIKRLAYAHYLLSTTQKTEDLS